MVLSLNMISPLVQGLVARDGDCFLDPPSARIRPGLAKNLHFHSMPITGRFSSGCIVHIHFGGLGPLQQVLGLATSFGKLRSMPTLPATVT